MSFCLPTYVDKTESISFQFYVIYVIKIDLRKDCVT